MQKYLAWEWIEDFTAGNSSNRVVRKLQFLNNFHIKIAFLQGFSLKKCRTCEGINGVPEQVQ